MVVTKSLAKRLDKKIGGLLTLRIGVEHAIHQLGPSNEQLEAFCKATPEDSVELLAAYEARKDAAEDPKKYLFPDYMKEVLAKTEYPILT